MFIGPLRYHDVYYGVLLQNNYGSICNLPIHAACSSLLSTQSIYWSHSYSALMHPPLSHTNPSVHSSVMAEITQ